MPLLNGKHRKFDRHPEEIENDIIKLFATVYSGSVDEIMKKYGEKGFEAIRKGFIDAMVKSDIEEFKKMYE